MKTLSGLSSILLGVVALIFFAGPFGLHPALHPDMSRNQPPNAQVRLSGEKARAYLQQTNEGQSLAQALTAARFGLQWQENAPGDIGTGGGYVGMSHEQNLRAWFGKDGVTVRPTLPEEKRDQAWSMGLRLKAYGYGGQL